jgi:hypothetical protein
VAAESGMGVNQLSLLDQESAQVLVYEQAGSDPKVSVAD